MLRRLYRSVDLVALNAALADLRRFDRRWRPWIYGADLVGGLLVMLGIPLIARGRHGLGALLITVGFTAFVAVLGACHVARRPLVARARALLPEGFDAVD